MKCKRIKELLLTDYIDDGIDIVLREEFDKHVASCTSCGSYKMSIDKGLSPLFKKAGVKPPQDEIWQNIRTRITHDNQEAASKVFALSPFLRRNIFAFATAAVLLFVIISFRVVSNSQRAAVNNFLLAEGSFLYSLSSNNGQETFNHADFGTAAEEYFF